MSAQRAAAATPPAIAAAPARRGFPQPGQQGALGAGFAHLAMADLEAEVAGEAAAAGLQVLGLGAGRGPGKASRAS